MIWDTSDIFHELNLFQTKCHEVEKKESVELSAEMPQMGQLPRRGQSPPFNRRAEQDGEPRRSSTSLYAPI